MPTLLNLVSFLGDFVCVLPCTEKPRQTIKSILSKSWPKLRSRSNAKLVSW